MPRSRASGSAPAIASLTRSPSPTGSGLEAKYAGMDAGQLEEIVDHPDHPVDLVPDPPLIAARVLGQPVLERLGHRPHPGERGAEVVGDPGDQLATGVLEPGLAVTGLGQLDAGRRELVGQGLELAGAAHRGAQPSAGRPGCGRRHEASATSARTPRPRPWRPPARRRRPLRPPTNTTTKSCSEMNIARAVPTSPARTCGYRDDGDSRRSASATTGADPPRRGRVRLAPTPPAQAAAIRTISSWSLTCAPSGSPRPTRSPAAPDGSGRPRPSRAAGGRAP